MGKELILNEIGKECVLINDSIPHINYGGCGLFAERLYDLLSNLGFSPKIGIFTQDKEMMGKRLIGEADSCDATIYHIVIICKGIYLDSRGTFSSAEECYRHPFSKLELFEDITIGELVELNRDIDLWNPTFERSNVVNIQKKLNIIYNKVVENYVNSK